MMRITLANFSVLFGAYLLCSSNAFAQGGRGILAADPKNANRPYDKHDISGIWSRNGSPGGYGGGGTCRDCGDRGYPNVVPASRHSVRKCSTRISRPTGATSGVPM